MKPKKFGDLFGKDLTGWKIVECHFLELQHRLMGTFPALTTEGEIVALLNKKSLRAVWSRIKRREAKVTSIMVVMNSKKGTAFCLENYHKENTKPLRIFSEEELTLLCQKENPFKWASGLFGGTGEPVADPDFN